MSTLVRDAQAAGTPGRLRGALRRAVRANREICWRIQRVLPHARPNPLELYRRAVAAVVRPGDVVLDVGGGISCSYAADAGSGVRVIALDISEEELRPNRDAQARLAADVGAGLPLRDRSVDVITSRYLLEHLRDPEALLAEARRVLRPGGRMVHLCPSPYAPFALLNRVLPARLAHWSLRHLTPALETHDGFTAYYRRTNYSALMRMLADHGFQPMSSQIFYYQSPYYAFFVPLYLASAAYELACYKLNLRDLAAAVLVTARLGPAVR